MSPAAARRGGAGGRGFLVLSAALHLLALAAALWWAGRSPLPGAAEVPVALVWNRVEEGAGEGDDAGAPTAPRGSPPVPEPPQPAALPAPAPAAAPAAPAERASAEAPPAPPVAGPEPVALPLPPPPAPPQPVPPQPVPERRASAAFAAPTARPEVAEGLAALAGGGGLAAGAVVPPRPATGAANPAPNYPSASRIRGEQGRVTMLVQVDAGGRVLGLSVVGSSGHAALDEEAQRTVRGWQFEPATQDGRPVFSSVTVGITFRLEGERRW